MARKGQSIPIDFVAGLFIFLFMLAFFLMVWDSYTERYIAMESSIDMETTAIGIADLLVSTGGSPGNWTAEPLAAQSIGLAWRQNELDWYRLSALSSLPYASAKMLLGADREFAIKIETLDGGRLATYPPGWAGAAASGKAVEVTRVAMMNGSAVNVKVQVYEN
ncbi:MAG: hypothetical protein WC263_00790 [Candidatus Micrarchaeia archaeon]